MKRFIYILLLLTLNVVYTSAQYPRYFSYDTENGLPSNEVYSIVQDRKGFIWIGCDAGIFKFDGLRYTAYKSKTQKSKSITGLTISSSGKIYCYNFQSQIFCMDKDNLIELKHTLPNAIINSMTSDVYGNVYVTHAGGISAYNENQKKWKDYFEYSPEHTIKKSLLAGKSVKGNEKNEITFCYSKGIAAISDNKLTLQHKTDIFSRSSSANFEIENYDNTLWIFSKESGIIYRYRDGKTEQVNHTKLNELLAKRKITAVKALPDGDLWICTYKGVVRYNAQHNTADLFYPESSFTDVLIGREHNYWFSTLQTGMLRVPDLTFSVWNNFENNQLVKIATDNTQVYFASVNGTVGKINALTHELKTFYTGKDADIQSLDYDVKQNTLYFNINNHLYQLKNNTISETGTKVNAIKSYQKVGNTAFALSSQGVFINGKKISTEWARALKYDEPSQIVWIATNNGLQKYAYQNDAWQFKQTLLPNTQILSLDFDKSTGQLFVLIFDGQLCQINAQSEVRKIAQLSDNVQVQKLKFYNQKLYIATNKGIWIYDLITNKWNTINALSGLVSDNIQDVTIVNNSLWVVTGKGLQKIPLNRLNTPKPLAAVYLSNQFPNATFQLKHNEALILKPEASIYAANGNYQYAYRINNTDWVKLPASIEQIKIQTLPTGSISIELKAIDHLGRDSGNVIVLKGYVTPPFWKTWWFYLSLIVAGTIVAVVISKVIIRNIRRKELGKTQLINSQLKAIRAQMNPHFMYNTLNSIQDLILQNDIKNSNYYLSKFSQLMRQILVFSEEDNVLLSEEAEMLNNYLELEKLRFGDDFIYTLNIEKNIDSGRTYIPSLIVQPYVENAVKHGLLHKKGVKTLDITFAYSESFLEIRIEDNGIGRKRSEAIKQRSGIFHNSFAGDAIQKRLELLNNSSKQKIEISISNLDAKDENSGTRVIILLPVNPKQPFVKN